MVLLTALPAAASALAASHATPRQGTHASLSRQTKHNRSAAAHVDKKRQHRKLKRKHHKLKLKHHRTKKGSQTTTTRSTTTSSKAPTGTQTQTTKATSPAATHTTAATTTTTTPGLSGGPESSQWFSSTSIWRGRLPSQTPVAGDSATLVASLSNAVYNGGAPWINTSPWSTPVYTVPQNQPVVKVTLTKPNAALQQAFNSVPLPAGAQPAAGTDEQLVVWQPSTDTMWEFWQLQRSSTGSWTAAYGGMMNSVSSNPGYYTGADALWGATATSLPLLGGLITIDDLQRGAIDHALAMAVPNTAYAEYTWPAQRTDGYDKAADAIPEGTRFRIPASVNLASLNLSPATLELAVAAQRYGIIVRDTAANVAFYAEDPTPTGSNPYPALWGTSYPSKIMAAFPWSLLQVVDDGPVTHGW